MKLILVCIFYVSGLAHTAHTVHSGRTNLARATPTKILQSRVSDKISSSSCQEGAQTNKAPSLKGSLCTHHVFADTIGTFASIGARTEHLPVPSL